MITKNIYSNLKHQAAHENACDCLYYGYGRDVWNKYDLDDETADRIWQNAKKTLAKGRRY